jgi:hypothetical protein
MSRNTSQPPYTPQQAAARAKSPPESRGGQHSAGSAHTGFGKGGAAKVAKRGAFKPGLRTGVKGGRN